jgi:hypothetical protein
LQLEAAALPAPAAPVNVGIVVRDPFNPGAEDTVPEELFDEPSFPDDPDDDEPPAAWAAPAA